MYKRHLLSLFILNAQKDILTETGGEYSARDDKPRDSVLLALNICVYSSVCFYIFQMIHATYILYRLIWKNEKSKTLIAATLMLALGSLVLAVFFAISSDVWYDNKDWSAQKKVFYILCYTLPYTIVFIAHLICLY